MDYIHFIDIIQFGHSYSILFLIDLDDIRRKKRAEAKRRYRLKHADKIKEYKKEYNKKNAERKKVLDAAYYQKNAERKKVLNAAYYQKKRKLLFEYKTSSKQTKQPSKLPNHVNEVRKNCKVL